MSHPITSQQPQITELLGRISSGDSFAREQLAGIVYPELRRIAGNLMRYERKNHTLQPTAICNEAYIRLLGDGKRSWQNRTHFFACASTEMRHIVVDYARLRKADKRGGRLRRVDIDVLNMESAEVNLDIVLSIDEALTKLAEIDPRQSRIIEMRYFGGLTEEQVAEALSLSVRTVRRDWAVARDWLYAELTREAEV